MSATIIDSAIFQGIFSSDEMRQVWSDENRTQKYLDIEAALARVQARPGLIPQEAADEIVSHCRLDHIDMAKLRQRTERKRGSGPSIHSCLSPLRWGRIFERIGNGLVTGRRRNATVG
jgi:hypothetical protein